MHGDHGPDQEDRGHRPEYRPALALVARVSSERVGEREGHGEHQEHLDEVGQRCRVLERVGRVRVQETATVVAQLLDDFLRGDRAEGDGLLGSLQRGRGGRGVQRLGHALPDEEDGEDNRDRKEDVEDAAGQVHPEAAERLRAPPGETANERDRDGLAGGGRGEVADGQDQHLAQVAGPGLARVVLPVGVRLEADRRVERQVR